MRCLALFSGGLDSMLAIKIMSLQGFEVIALHLDMGFGGKKIDEEKLNYYANKAGAKLAIVDIKERYLKDVLFSPKYGYGKHLNPCIDCHGYMFRVAFEMLEQLDAKFIISGEVVGQRPMSQRTEALRNVEKLNLKYEGLMLRPLSAKLLKPTKPELDGIVDREKLLDISGRGRQRQLLLADEFGFDSFEAPAGGCLLTIDSFCKKMKDVINHEKLENAKDIELLKFGRHLRLEEGAKLIISRDEVENRELSAICNPKFDEILLDGCIGPYALISKEPTKVDLELAFSLVLAYAKTNLLQSYSLIYRDEKFKKTATLTKQEAAKYFV